MASYMLASQLDFLLNYYKIPWVVKQLCSQYNYTASLRAIYIANYCDISPGD